MQLEALRQGLRDEGYNEGQNLAIDYRFAEEHLDQLPDLAADLVRRQVDVLVVGGGTTTALASKAATTTIPIVFSVGRSGESRPCGQFQPAGREHDRRGTVQRNLDYKSANGSLRNDYDRRGPQSSKCKCAQSCVRFVGSSVYAGPRGSHLICRKRAAIRCGLGVLASVVEERIGALVVMDDPLFITNAGPHLADAYRQVWLYVGRVLKGEKPANLPVLQPTKIELVINLKAAKALGAHIPPALLSRADGVIE